MNALFALGNHATAEEIRARLAEPPTGSSVRVMLAGLEKRAICVTPTIRALHQIDNAPEWVDSDRFDVVAKAPSRATPQQMREMLRSFLAE